MYGWSRRPGTYALVLCLDQAVTVRIGRLGPLAFAPGWYIYVGSARGPGGLLARLSRHNRSEKRLHWHIDYLLEHARLREVWSVETADRLECDWVVLVATLPGLRSAVPGFGAGDCRCRSHLFAFDARPAFDVFAEMTARSGQPALTLTRLD